MKKNIIGHLFKEAVSILKRSIVSDRKISGFETIIIPVERKQISDYFLHNEKFRTKQ